MLNPKEINIANSIDWLCYQSGTVATVKVTSVKEESFHIMDYESEVTIYANISRTYKGNEPLSRDIIIYSRLTYVGMDKWKNMLGKEVLVFLKDLICERQCAYGIWDDDRGMIPVDSPGTKALTGDFNYLEDSNDIINYVVDRITQLKGKKAESHFLEVPMDTKAFGALYGGSSCYLIVPDVLYPKSKKGMF